VGGAGALPAAPAPTLLPAAPASAPAFSTAGARPVGLGVAPNPSLARTLGGGGPGPVRALHTMRGGAAVDLGATFGAPGVRSNNLLPESLASLAGGAFRGVPVGAPTSTVMGSSYGDGSLSSSLASSNGSITLGLQPGRGASSRVRGYSPGPGRLKGGTGPSGGPAQGWAPDGAPPSRSAPAPAPAPSNALLLPSMTVRPSGLVHYVSASGGYGPPSPLAGGGGGNVTAAAQWAMGGVGGQGLSAQQTALATLHRKEGRLGSASSAATSSGASFRPPSSEGGGGRPGSSQRYTAEPLPAAPGHSTVQLRSKSGSSGGGGVPGRWGAETGGGGRLGSASLAAPSAPSPGSFYVSSSGRPGSSGGLGGAYSSSSGQYSQQVAPRAAPGTSSFTSSMGGRPGSSQGAASMQQHAGGWGMPQAVTSSRGFTGTARV